MKKKLNLKLLPVNEALVFMYSEFLKFKELDVEANVNFQRLVQIRNLVDGRDEEDVEFTENSLYSLWELASGVENELQMSTQELKASINQLKSLYSSRIAEEAARFKRKIQELQAQHDSWVAKEYEELDELVQNRIKTFNRLKGRKENLLLCQSICIDDDATHDDDAIQIQEILEPCIGDQIKSSQNTASECPRACFFNLSDISDSSDSGII